jgi:hypothetical protein
LKSLYEGKPTTPVITKEVVYQQDNKISEGSKNLGEIDKKIEEKKKELEKETIFQPKPRQKVDLGNIYANPPIKARSNLGKL